MTLSLPEAFLRRIQQQLGEELPDFSASYTQPRVAGLRVQTGKMSSEALRRRLPGLGSPIPWAQDGFYIDDEAMRPAKHPYYYAGVYYIQEPSAMLPAELLDVEPGDRVLDLCAAPGGKSVQLATRLGRTGLLVANDIHPQRSRVLLKNLERCGVVNAVVTNATPEQLARVFGGYFDKVLVDAPCSGEGMFRKEPAMIRDWSPESVEHYATLQAAILAVAPSLIRPGGKLVYSTCTFSTEENERQVERFLANNSAFQLTSMRRLWPHQVAGEGHFSAQMRHAGRGVQAESIADVQTTLDEVAAALHSPQPREPIVDMSDSTPQLVQAFSHALWGDESAWQTCLPAGGRVVERAGHVLWEHADLPQLKGLTVLRTGWLLGTLEKKRFRPSTAFATGLPSGAISTMQHRCDLTMDDADEAYTAIRYLRGETIGMEDRTWDAAWHLVCVDGCALGWAKGAGAWLKNEYPPGWRWEAGR